MQKIFHLQGIPMTQRRRGCGCQRLVDYLSSRLRPNLTLALDGRASLLPLTLSMSLRCEQVMLNLAKSIPVFKDDAKSL